MIGRRRHLTQLEVDGLLAAASSRRHSARDRCLIMLMFRHGLRASEAASLTLDRVDIAGRIIHVSRLKGGLSTTHPLRTEELTAIRAWLKERTGDSPYFFTSERGERLSRSAIHQIIKNCGEAAQLPLRTHPHMLRHACGFALADQGADTRLIQDYLGHRSISNTVIYTASNPSRFERLFR